MTVGEEINFWGSLLCLLGCMAFVGYYTFLAFRTGRMRWWHDRVGKMMVTKALAIAGLMLLTVAFYLFNIDAEWIRGIRGVFSAVVGAMMCYQTYLVHQLQTGDGGKDDR
jgi:hypothetical protein